MTEFDPPGDLRGATFTNVDLRSARFRGCDLRDVAMRGVDAAGLAIDSPWLLGEGGSLFVNGVDVAPFVNAELDRRFPGRAQRRAADPQSLREAWAAVEAAWAAAVARAEALPPGSVDVSVTGEWSFAQTLRHLVMATDVWLRKAVLGVERPYHPIGQPNPEYAADGGDLSVFSAHDPSWNEVLRARADRVAMVREFIASTTPEQLAEQRRNPWAPDHAETVRSCLHTIVEEEWEHLRYALRDLDTIATSSDRPPAAPG